MKTYTFTEEQIDTMATRIVMHTALKLILETMKKKDDTKSLEPIFQEVSDIIKNFDCIKN
jgi:hypothetical protein